MSHALTPEMSMQSELSSVKDLSMQAESVFFSDVYFPLGFPLRIRVNRPEVLDMARESWDVFTCSGPYDDLTLQLDFFYDPQQCPMSEPKAQVHENFLTIAFDESNVVVVDLKQGSAHGRLNEALLKDRRTLRYYVLEAVALSMISALRAVALHAACVEWKGAGMLLCGESGAGKTTLAYACARKGWGYITDDASYLLLDDAERQVTGNCYQVRFRDTASELFRELQNRAITKRAEGKPSIEISAKELQDIRSQKSVRVQSILFLNRHSDLPPGFYPISRERVRDYFTKFLLISNQPESRSHAAIEYLLGAKMFEFRYSDLNAAVDFLSRSME